LQAYATTINDSTDKEEDQKKPKSQLLEPSSSSKGLLKED